MSTIETRAAAEAHAVLEQFARLESLGQFVGEAVDEQKHVFLTFALVNFARREALIHGEAAPQPQR